MIRISRRERKLKTDSRRGDDFDQLKQRLEEAGIFNKTGRGEVVYFNQRKGYGFIRVDGGDCFLHISVITEGEYPARGDCYDVVVDNQNKVKSAHRIDSKGK